MYAYSFGVRSTSKTAHNAQHTTYFATCEDRITREMPSTNEWLTITGQIESTNARDLSRVLTGILDKRKAVAIKISTAKLLDKENTIYTLVKTVPGFLTPYCYFKCSPGDSMGVLVLPYMEEGSMRNYNWTALTSPNVLRSCLQQVVCSLIQAYTLKGIIHNDMHVDNVLLRKTKKHAIEYTIEGRKISVPTNGYAIAIMDFDMAFNERPTDRGRASGPVYDDILHAIFDVQFQSRMIDVRNDTGVFNTITNLKETTPIGYDACVRILSDIEKIEYTPKHARSFVYDPYVVNGGSSRS